MHSVASLTHKTSKDVIGQNNVVDVGKLSSENTNDTNRKEATAVPTLASSQSVKPVLVLVYTLDFNLFIFLRL